MQYVLIYDENLNGDDDDDGYCKSDSGDDFREIVAGVGGRNRNCGFYSHLRQLVQFCITLQT